MKSAIVSRNMGSAHFRMSRFLLWEEELGVGISHVVRLSNLCFGTLSWRAWNTFGITSVP